MPTGSPNRDKELLENTRKVVGRWGIELAENPKDIQRAIKTGLRDAAGVAGKTPFESIYPEDHSWMGGGMRGIDVQRIRDDSVHSGLEKGSDQWGVVATVSAFERAIIVPIAYDLSEETALEVVAQIEGNEDAYLDLREVGPVLLDDGPGESGEELEVTIVAGNWSDLRDLAANHSCLSMIDALHFRRPVTWDLLRARMSDASLPELSPFVDAEFERRRNLSVRHDKRAIESSLEMLRSIGAKNYDLNTAEGIDWFSVMCDCLQSIGKGHVFEGLSVILHFEVLKPAENADRAASYDHYGMRNVCIAYGLDPVQALFIQELAEMDAERFVDFSDEGFAFSFLTSSVVPDMHLSMIRATHSGRDAQIFEELVTASSDPLAA